MTDKARRKELTEQYRQTIPEAGVYLIRNAGNGKALLGSTVDLGSLRNKLEFARTTNMPSVLDGRMARDIAQFGIDALSLDVLEVVDVTPEMTDGQVRDDLATLVSLWREKLGSSTLY
jgi:hypothetical protein